MRTPDLSKLTKEQALALVESLTDEAIWVDGEPFTMDDLSYREQREARELTRDLVPDGDIDRAGDADIIPAMVCVIRRRANPQYKIDEALEVKPTDLLSPGAKKAAGPPRKRGS